jgi:hypothetical protein
LVYVRGAEWREVFNPYQVLSLNLELSPADWDRVRMDQPSQDEGWVPEMAEANFWAEGEMPIRVSVRRKGQSDLPLPEGASPQKVSLKIDINEPVPGQKWRGLTKLSLENGGTDPLREGFAWMAHRLAGGMFGYEAGNAAWVKLYVNGEFKGVFVNAEQRNTQFLQNHGYYKEGATWLYKVDGSSSLESGVGTSPAQEHLCYPPFNSGPGKGGGQGECIQPDLEVDLPQWIDLRGFFTLAAVGAFVENTDALFTHSGKNSYAVDFDPPYPRRRLYFPWDLDTTIRQGDQSIYGNEPYQTTFLSHAWFGQVYEQTLRDLLAGPFSEAALHAEINKLEQALGPAFDQDPYVYGGSSDGAFSDLRQWVTRRVANVRSQLLRPYLERPKFDQEGGEVVAGFLLTMSAPAGTIYYTTDGSDPRNPGGAISPKARAYTGPVVIEKTAQIVARSFNGTLWSALPTSATFNIARYASPLRITEMMYHPAGDAAALSEEYEFIELRNTGTAPLDLSGFYFEGIDFTFPAQATVPAGSFIVLVRNPAAFARRYPAVAYHGVYWGKLSDSGEKIRLRNSDGNTIVSVEYDDDPPWPLSPDGLGYSLVLKDAAGEPDNPEVWRVSAAVGGSPGRNDPEPGYGHGLVINEVLAHSDPPFEDAVELYNPTAAPIAIGGWYLSDDFNRTNGASGYDLKKYRIPDGTIVPSEGYVVFYQRDFMERNANAPFALSEFGETVYLASASNGNLTGLIIGAQFGATERNVSVGRYRTSTGVDFTTLLEPTLGFANASSLEDFRSGKGALNSGPKVGPIVINEIMYNAKLGGTEFIELLNISSEAVDISGWNVAGAAFTFPANTILSANGLVLLVDTNLASVEQFRASHNVPTEVPVFRHGFVLENEGEALRLEKPNVAPLEPYLLMDRVRYNDKAPWPTEADGEGPSLERFAGGNYGNDPVNWRTVSDGGSPGRLNIFPAGVAIARGSSWKYQANGGDLGTAWRMLDYSDSSWLRGDGALGYGAGDLLTPFYFAETTKPITTRFRKEFVVNDPPGALRNLALLARFDDGFVLYLNGEEVARSASMPAGTVRFDTVAQNYNSLSYERFDLSNAVSRLVAGRNVIAVELHQDSAASEDAVWDAALSYEVSTAPTLEAPVIDPPGGTFQTPVTVQITNSAADAVIRYTVDGTPPDSSSPRYTGPFGISGSTQVKARAYKAGYNESAVSSAQFILATVVLDSDQDGMPDDWEISFFGSASSGDPNGDPDNDGLSNLQEYLAGTDPMSGSSTLKITGVHRTPEGITLRWSSTSGSIYRVEECVAVGASGPLTFTVIASGIPATPGTNSFSVPVSAGPKLYRIEVEQ